MSIIPHHPLADLFPMFTAPQLAELAVSIKKRGQEVKGTTYEDPTLGTTLLDGRNRQKACRIAGVKFLTEPYEGNDPLGFVLSHNLDRRHLSVDERALIAAKLVQMGKTTEQGAADQLNVSRSSVQRAKRDKLPSAGAKPKREEKLAWTHAELKADTTGELTDIFTAISVVYGNDDTRVIREGNLCLPLKEIKFLAKLPKDKMLEIQELVFGLRLTPTKAYAFVNKMADDSSSVTELIQWCVATKGKFWTGNFRDGAFTITVKANRAISRGHDKVAFVP